MRQSNKRCEKCGSYEEYSSVNGQIDCAGCGNVKERKLYQRCVDQHRSHKKSHFMKLRRKKHS